MCSGMSTHPTKKLMGKGNKTVVKILENVYRSQWRLFWRITCKTDQFSLQYFSKRSVPFIFEPPCTYWHTIQMERFSNDFRQHWRLHIVTEQKWQNTTIHPLKTILDMWKSIIISKVVQRCIAMNETTFSNEVCHAGSYGSMSTSSSAGFEYLARLTVLISSSVFCQRAGPSLQTQAPRLQFCPKAGLPWQTQEPRLQFY